MTEPEPYSKKKRDFKGPWQKRQERRVAKANELESSAAAVALKAELSRWGENSLVTVTHPETHPFARIRAQGLFGNLGPSMTAIVNDRYGMRVTTNKDFRLVQITKQKPRKGKPDGVVIRSRDTNESLSINASPIEATAAIQRAIAKPLDITQTFSPRSWRTQRRI